MNLHVRPLKYEDLEKIVRFTDRTIGSGYYTLAELEDKLRRSQKNGKTTSFVLVDLDLPEGSDNIFGLRLSYPPGNWQKGKGDQLSPQLWSVPLKQTAYFQSLFLDPKINGEGWGPKLSAAAIEVLRELGARAIVCHSWVESPNNSSNKYLTKMGFKSVKKYPLYWKNVDYVCTRCGKPCLCTAEEMILVL